MDPALRWAVDHREKALVLLARPQPRVAVALSVPAASDWVYFEQEAQARNVHDSASEKMVMRTAISGAFPSAPQRHVLRKFLVANGGGDVENRFPTGS